MKWNECKGEVIRFDIFKNSMLNINSNQKLILKSPICIPLQKLRFLLMKNNEPLKRKYFDIYWKYHWFKENHLFINYCVIFNYINLS